MVFAPFTGKDNHGKCVTFGVGLLSKEDVESYSWLMNKFVKCMGKTPSLIITDQDLGIKVAVERVLIGTRHRFCMWHIMLKIADKVPTYLKKDEEFKKCLNNVVWSEDIEPDDFEAGWIKIMKDFGLIGDKWFESMYENRSYWIPAYFRDFRMSGLVKTTSISESENSVFGRYMRSKSNLVELFMHFDSAIDSQRHSNTQLSYIDESCINKLETRVPFEKHVSSVYTLRIFDDVQEQILTGLYDCSLRTTVTSENVEEYEIVDGRNKVWNVVHNFTEDTFACSCKLFVRFGLLCSHIFIIFRNLKLRQIPDKYIVGCWTKKPFLKPVHDVDYSEVEPYAIVDESSRLSGRVVAGFFKCLGSVEGNNEKLSELLEYVTVLEEKYKCGDNISSLVSSKKSMLEKYYGSKRPEKVTYFHLKL